MRASIFSFVVVGAIAVVSMVDAAFAQGAYSCYGFRMAKDGGPGPIMLSGKVSETAFSGSTMSVSPTLVSKPVTGTVTSTAADLFGATAGESGTHYDFIGLQSANLRIPSFTCGQRLNCPPTEIKGDFNVYAASNALLFCEASKPPADSTCAPQISCMTVSECPAVAGSASFSGSGVNAKISGYVCSGGTCIASEASYVGALAPLQQVNVAVPNSNALVSYKTVASSTVGGNIVVKLASTVKSAFLPSTMVCTITDGNTAAGRGGAPVEPGSGSGNSGSFGRGAL